MSILKSIKSLKHASPVSESLQTIIQSKVITLFNQACSIDDSVMDYEFEPIVCGVCSLTSLFKYAVVDIIINEDQIAVEFHLRVEHTGSIVPAGSQELVIIADDDMNYKSAIFKSVFSFVGEGLKGTINLDRKIDAHFKSTTALSYSISSYGFLMLRVNFKDEKIPKIYFSDNNNFYEQFLKMIDYCFNQPEIFYSVFDGYPLHKDMLTYEYEFKNFLRLYNNDYKNGKKLLKAKLSLLDMQAI